MNRLIRKILLLVEIIVIISGNLSFAESQNVFLMTEEKKLELLDFVANVLSSDSLSQEEQEMFRNCNLEDAYILNYLEVGAVAQIKADGLSSSLLTDLVQWKVPCTLSNGDSAQLTINVTDTGLSYVGYGYGENIQSKYVLIDNLVSAVKENTKIGNVSKIAFYLATEFNSVFALISADNGYFVVPYADNQVEKEANIENGEIYKLEDIVNYLDDAFDLDFYVENPEQNGGPALKQSSSLITLICVSSILIIALVVTLVLYKKSKQ